MNKDRRNRQLFTVVNFLFIGSVVVWACHDLFKALYPS